jgi:hypothetical protein
LGRRKIGTKLAKDRLGAQKRYADWCFVSMCMGTGLGTTGEPFPFKTHQKSAHNLLNMAGMMVSPLGKIFVLIIFLA